MGIPDEHEAMEGTVTDEDKLAKVMVARLQVTFGGQSSIPSWTGSSVAGFRTLLDVLRLPVTFTARFS